MTFELYWCLKKVGAILKLAIMALGAIVIIIQSRLR